MPGCTVAILSLEERNLIRDAWDKFKPVPGGSRLFDKMLGAMVPYSGSIKSEVKVLEPGYCEIQLKDRRGVRNHLKSVHAIALVNLAELAGNLALQYSMPDDGRFIVAGLRAKYLKKARGTLTARSHAPILDTAERQEYEIKVEISNEKGEVVTEVYLETLVGPKKRG